MTKPKVVIDGVRYVPASESIANADQVARALAETWAGPDISAKDMREYMTYLRVVVSDDSDFEHHPTLQDFMATLREQLRQER